MQGLLPSVALLGVSALACGAASASTVYWDQTQTFRLDATPEAVIKYEGQADPPRRRFEQNGTLTFQGAPAGFTLAGVNYSLSAVQAVFTSTFANTFVVSARETDYFGDINATGSAVTTTVVAFPMPGAAPAYWYDSWNDTIYATSLLFGTADIPGGFSQRRSNVSWDYDFTRNWTDTRSFVETASFDVYLFKGLMMTLSGYSGDDDWDAASNPVSNWSGSMTLRYVYDSQSPPVPEPRSVALLGLGLLGLGLRRYRAAPS